MMMSTDSGVMTSSDRHIQPSIKGSYVEYGGSDYDRYLTTSNSKGYAKDDEEEDDEDNSIEEVGDDKIEDVVNENDKNLLIFYYDRDSKCSKCKMALEKLEQIDDDLEYTGFIEVVKCRDKRSAQEQGVTRLPGVVYFRRKNPILYNGNFEENAEELLRWFRAHEEVVTVELDDGNFEDKTDTYSPSKNSLDWFVLFYDSKKPECNSYVSIWEAVAYNFRKGKMYRLHDGGSKDVEVLTTFAVHKYKEHRGRRVPEPPTAIQELFEGIKECMMNKLGENFRSFFTFCSVSLLFSAAAFALWFVKTNKFRQLRQQPDGKSQQQQKTKET